VSSTVIESAAGSEPEGKPLSKVSRCFLLALLSSALLATSAAAAGHGALKRPEPKILSASWGTDNAVGCPGGAQGLDNIPVTFNWFVRRASIQPADFRIVRSDGTAATPTCALRFPPNESDEAQTVNLIGDFGSSVDGPTPASIRVVGKLNGRPPGARIWRDVGRLPKVGVDPLSGGPYIVDAWRLPPSIYRGDANRCEVGKTFLRVMWSNGLTAYPTGEEVGAPVTASYRARLRLPSGRTAALAPLEVADLHDHESSFNADNMHDLCLGKLPAGAQLTGVTIAADLIQDPNGDPNPAQRFRALPGAGSGFAQPGVIEGVVTAAASGAGVEGAEICASASVEGDWFTQCAVARSNGAYEVTGLPEAIYRVQFTSGESGQKLVTEYWRNTTNPNAAKLIQVNEGQWVNGIDAQLQAG
jgi:hypothetical protein